MTDAEDITIYFYRGGNITLRLRQVTFGTDFGKEKNSEPMTVIEDIVVEPAQGWIDCYENLMLHFPREEVWLPREYPEEYAGSYQSAGIVSEVMR